MYVIRPTNKTNVSVNIVGKFIDKTKPVNKNWWKGKPSGSKACSEK